MSKVVAVVVTYHPDIDVLHRLISAIAFQVDRVVVVDNGSSNVKPLDCAFDNSVEWILNPDNAGVAAAYNQGVAVAERIEATHVILFDQDSYPDPEMVSVLISSWEQAKKSGQKIAALGPNYVDTKGRYQSPFVKIEGFSLQRLECKKGEVVALDHLISSGCLIDIEALRDVGRFEEALFIDYVDTEWCLRARHKGYILLGVADAAMQHNLGDEYLKLFNRRIPMRSPIRHYYVIRNGLWLISQPWVGWRWRYIDAVRLTKQFIVFSLFGEQRLRHIKMMLLGLLDFSRKQMGKVSLSDR